MNIPIKMIGITTAFLWLFLIAFSISAALSLKDLQFSFGSPQMTLAGNNQLQLSLPLSITNGGKYDMQYFNVTGIARNGTGGTIAQSSTLIDTISAGQTVNTTQITMLNMADLLQNDRNLLFNDSQLTLDEYVGLTLAGLFPLRATANVSIPWGAPLYNLTLENPEYRPYNATHFIATVPISFENHAEFGFAGTIQTEMFNGVGTLVAQNNTNINVTQHSPYQGFVDLYLPISSLSPLGHFEVYILTSFMNYGPIVISYG
jgi:hypothetical protein